MEGKLMNADGEFLASGPCEVSIDKGEVTMWPSWEVTMLERQRGELALDLADGSRMRISDRHLTFKLQGPTEQRITVYRLRILPMRTAERVPEHLAVGYEEPAADAQEQAPAPETAKPDLHIVNIAMERREER
jgi:hypothetical protein